MNQTRWFPNKVARSPGPHQHNPTGSGQPQNLRSQQRKKYGYNSSEWLLEKHSPVKILKSPKQKKRPEPCKSSHLSSDLPPHPSKEGRICNCSPVIGPYLFNLLQKLRNRMAFVSSLLGASFTSSAVGVILLR